MESKTEERLQAAGLRRTRDRVRALDALLATARPLTHGEVEYALPGVDRVTLYRVLDALEAAGLAHRILGADGVWRFRAHDDAPAGCPGGHPHFLCLRCGRMTCLTNQTLPRIDVPRGATVSRKQFVASGLCEDCMSAAEAET